MNVLTNTFRWRWLIGCQLGAFGLLGSWVFPPTRIWWDRLDSTVFSALNGSLAELGSAWQTLWAVGNNRGMDLLMAAVFAGLYLHFVLSGDPRRRLPDIMIGCFIALYAFLVLELSRNILFTFDRLSPTLYETGAVRLSHSVAWANPKDASGNSFPGDHAIALFVFVTMIWFYAGRRYGIVSLVAAVLCSLPRLMSGAHWISDLLVGSVFVGLVLQSLVLATPLHLLVSGAAERLGRLATPRSVRPRVRERLSGSMLIGTEKRVRDGLDPL